MANWRKTSMPDVWVAHQARCPAFDDEDARCRCTPSWRGRRGNPAKRDSKCQKPVTKDRSEVLSWRAAGKKGAEDVRERASSSRIFESIGDEWMAGVVAGRIGRRKGRSRPYTSSTVRFTEFMGHADLQMVNRCEKLLPQPGGEDLSQRLSDYLRRATEARP